MNTHDYRDGTRGYGHDITYTPERSGHVLRAMGWGHGLRRGDSVALTGPNGGVSVYSIRDVDYQIDPADMWSATLDFCDEVRARAAIRDLKP